RLRDVRPSHDLPVGQAAAAAAGRVFFTAAGALLFWRVFGVGAAAAACSMAWGAIVLRLLDLHVPRRWPPFALGNGIAHDRLSLVGRDRHPASNALVPGVPIIPEKTVSTRGTN